jgi:DNA-binding XRE family transcriptional regulator
MPSPFFEEFGRRMARRRHILRLKQHEVGEKIGMQRSHISSLEHGRQHMMRLDQVAALARVLRTSSDYLLQLVDVDPGEVPPLPCPGKGRCLDGRTPSPVTTLPREEYGYAEYTKD